MLIIAIETHRHKSIGTYLRCASAFGATTVIVVGSPVYATHGAHGAQNHVQVTHFYYWNECVAYCRELGCNIYAISPTAFGSVSETSKSASIDTYEFAGQNACFIVGEKDGLTAEQMQVSDAVLHVDVPFAPYADKVVYDSKVAICLQQFAVASNMEPRGFENEKHVLGEVNFRRPKTVKAGRANAKAAGEGTAEDAALEEPLDGLFS
jgi:hypothetical protein